MSETEHEHDDPEATEAPEPSVEPQDEELAEEEPGEPQEHADERAAPPQEASVSPEEWEDRFKKINARYKTYTRAVGTILEEDATDLLPCPLCSDAVPAFVNGNDAGKVPEETVGAVQAFLGYQAPAKLHTSRVNTRCETCGGLGELQTGSLVPKWETRVCDECMGCGYRGPGNPHDVPGSSITPAGETPNGPATINLDAALASIKEGLGT